MMQKAEKGQNPIKSNAHSIAISADWFFASIIEDCRYKYSQIFQLALTMRR